MVKLIKKKRKSPILTSSSIPCLKNLPTINITQGCSLGCIYCYIKSYPNYPGPESIVLFDNTAEILQEELKRRRKRPQRVYFSPSSDAFQYLPKVQDVTFNTMKVLLEQRVEIAFLTKGFIKERFFDLFRKHATLVHAQIGITSLDRGLWRTFEPRTSSPSQRIQTARKLFQIGVAVTVRLDPLIPDLTDTANNLNSLLSELRDIGVTFSAASYIFVRSGFEKELSAQLAKLRIDIGAWQQHRFTDGCGGGRTITIEDRRHRFAMLSRLGSNYGITIQPCRCKNPSLTELTCQIAGPRSAKIQNGMQQGTLPFDQIK